MKRRPKGTGTIIKMGDWYYGRITRKGKTRVIKLSRNQRESEGLWKKWIDENPASSGKDSVRHQVKDAWVNLEDLYVAKGTKMAILANYRRHFNLFKDWIASRGKQLLEEVTCRDIVDYIDATATGKSNKYKRDIVHVIKGLYKTNGIEDCPANNIKIAKDNIKPREPFTDDELMKILETAKNHAYFGNQFHALITLALYTGLRLKDCVYMSVEDIKGDVIMMTPNKTKDKGIEVRIPIHPKLKSELDSFGISSGHYFPDLVDLYEKGNIANHLRSIFRSVGEVAVKVKGRVRKVPVKGFHALRATFITRLAEKNVSLPIMESLAGHIDPRQTLHYTHPNEAIKKAAIDILNFDGTEDDKIFMHPEVKKLMDEFNRQKEDFLAKIESKIAEVMGEKDNVKVPVVKDAVDEVPTEKQKDGMVMMARPDTMLKRIILRRMGITIGTGRFSGIRMSQGQYESFKELTGGAK